MSIGRDGVFGAFADQFLGENRASAARANAAGKASASARSTTDGKSKSSARAEGVRGSSRASTRGLEGKTAHLEGRLNAAHASDRALSRASLNSTVGQIAAYKTALEAYIEEPNQENLTKTATALAGVANKSITTQTVTNLNAVLGVSVENPEVAAQIAEKAQAIQAGEGAGGQSTR